MSYKPYNRGTGSSFDDSPAAQATWNLKDDHRRILSDKLTVIIELIARVKLYDSNSMMKANPAMEVIYELIRPGLSKHFKKQSDEMDAAMIASRQILDELKPYFGKKSMPSDLVREYVISVEAVYRMLCNSMYMTGLGITLEQKMSPREMAENSLLD